MSELKEMECEEAESPRSLQRIWLIPANGVKKSDIWLLVCFWLKFRAKGPLETWVWEGGEGREYDGDVCVCILFCMLWVRSCC